jgi:hypothetical protein
VRVEEGDNISFVKDQFAEIVRRVTKKEAESDEGRRGVC